MGFRSPLFLLGLGSEPVVTQGGFKTPLPNWNAGAEPGVTQGGFLTPLPFWNAGTDGAVVEPPAGGGGRILKPRRYAKIISFAGDTGSFRVEERPEPVEESAKSYQQEIDRYGRAIDSLAFQIEAAEQELEILKARDEIESQIRLQLLMIDIQKAREFIFDLIQEIHNLLLIKERRREEELLLAILIADD